MIPEIGGPAHNAAGWQWAQKEGKGKLALCTDSVRSNFCPVALSAFICVWWMCYVTHTIFLISKLSEITLSLKNEPWFELSKEPPSGQINPINPEVYPILGELYRDLMDYFDPEMVHMGGDDVSIELLLRYPHAFTGVLISVMIIFSHYLHFFHFPGKFQVLAVF